MLRGVHNGRKARPYALFFPVSLLVDNSHRVNYSRFTVGGWGDHRAHTVRCPSHPRSLAAWSS